MSPSARHRGQSTISYQTSRSGNSLVLDCVVGGPTTYLLSIRSDRTVAAVQSRHRQWRIGFQRHADDGLETRWNRVDGVIRRRAGDAGAGNRPGRCTSAEDGSGIVRNAAGGLHRRQHGARLGRGGCRRRRSGRHLRAARPRRGGRGRPLAGRAGRSHAGRGPHAPIAQDAESGRAHAGNAGRARCARGFATSGFGTPRHAGGTDAAGAAAAHTRGTSSTCACAATT